MKVKICGITNLEDAVICENSGADALGFVHYPDRSRSISIDDVSEIIASLGPMTPKVLVCNPRSLSEALDLYGNAGVDILQVYSLEPADLTKFRENGGKIIRAVPPVRAEAARFADCTDALVFEAGRPGTGKSYDYSEVPIDACKYPIIAGGLTPDNLHLVRILRPYAVDVSSGVEKSIGKKDEKLVHEFVRRAKE